MTRKSTLIFGMLICTSLAWPQAKLSVHWEELTAAEFREAIGRAQGTCLLPMGIMEKHGPHLPIGNDLIDIRYRTLQAAEKEYAIVFPEYFVGQVFEVKHQPGTVAYSTGLQLAFLQETTEEMARNGCRKILIVNGHGGNNNLLSFFAQTQLEKPREYVVYVYTGSELPSGGPRPKTPLDMHAGELETSQTMIARPDLVHLERAGAESGADQQRKLPEGVYTAIWWYARFPNQYAGDGTAASREMGEFLTKSEVADLAKVIRDVKADQTAPRLQREFFEKSQHPLDTKP